MALLAEGSQMSVCSAAWRFSALCRDLKTTGDTAARALQLLSQQRTAAGNPVSSVYYDNAATFR